MLMVPTAGLRDHVTAVLAAPVTVEVKVALWPSPSNAVPGDRLITTGFKVTVAVAVFVESATLAAVTVSVCRLAIEAGAV